MSSSTVYANIIEEINKRPFMLTHVPETYTVVTDYHIEHGSFRKPWEDDVGRGNFSVSHMIDMYINKIPFRFGEPKDMEHIVNIIVNYLNFIYSTPQIHTLPKADKEQLEYYKAFVVELSKLIEKRNHHYYYHYPHQKPKTKSKFLEIIERFGATNV